MANLEIWLKGLLAAITSAVASAVVLMSVNHANFNITGGGLKNVGEVALTSAIVGAAFYLKQSPAPK